MNYYSVDVGGIVYHVTPKVVRGLVNQNAKLKAELEKKGCSHSIHEAMEHPEYQRELARLQYAELEAALKEAKEIFEHSLWREDFTPGGSQEGWVKRWLKGIKATLGEK